MKNVGLLFIAVLILCGTAYAERTVWYVHPDSALNTIQAGLDSCYHHDIVLVGPGIYHENIVWPYMQGINLVSEFGREYTIIDGDNDGTVIDCSYILDTTTLIRGFTIQNGWDNHSGGGICCFYSNPNITDVTISGNTGHSGGGIYCRNSSPNMENVTISGNTACAYQPLMAPTIYGSGGGIYCDNSSPSMSNVTISGNTGHSGGGIYCDNSSPSMSNVTISGNTGHLGGGIYCENSTLIFDAADRCNMYLNYAGVGCNLYALDCNTLDVIVDTFAVLQPDEHFAYPIVDFAFDILHAKIDQVDQDLHVSPDGSDDNSGLTVDDPLLTVSYALTKILADSTNPLVIHLANGVYSHLQTGEKFPLNCRSYVLLQGENENATVLDGDTLSRILFCDNDRDLSVENLTIHNGILSGMYCNNSNSDLANVTITGNNGRAIYCDNSSMNLNNVTISDNSGLYGGGIHCSNSNLNLVNAIISGNTSFGVHPVPSPGGGIRCTNSNLYLSNSTISGNTADGGGGIYSQNSNPYVLNCILWNNVPQEISVYSGWVTANYSNVDGGWPGVGNIDTDPMFVSGPLSAYHLSSNSPCVDAGNPDPQYNDPEDPLNPGYALWPALGTLRNDMGAYGGFGSGGWVHVHEHRLLKPSSSILRIHPNPFRDRTQIRYMVHGQRTTIQQPTLSIYDATGRLVRQWDHTTIRRSDYISWDGRDDQNRMLGSGVYFVRLSVGSLEEAKKVLFVR